MQILISGNEKKLLIDGDKFLKNLGLDSKIKLESFDISEKLLEMDEEKRKELFNSCIIKETEVSLKGRFFNTEEILKNEEKKNHEFKKDLNKEFKNLSVRTPEEIKRELKYCKNYIRRKQLNKELTISYKYFK